MPHTSSKEIETGAWLSGGGEMGALLRAFDGSQTSLGPLENWPHSLRLAVNLCLNAPMPLLLWWGTACLQFYNDAFRSLLDQAPPALGQTGPVAWGERWELLRPAVEATLRGEERGEIPDRLLLEGAGEALSLSFAYSPVRDEAGQIRGVWAAVTATPLPALAGPPSGDGAGSSLKLNATLTRPEEAGVVLPTPPNTYILNNMTDGFFILDRNWRFVYANNSGAALARQPVETLLGQNVWEIFTDIADHDDLRRQWQRAMEEQVSVDFDYYYPTYQDWVAFRVSPSPEGIVVFATNITNQKRAEEALRLSEERFAKAFLASPDGLVILRREDNRIIEVNPSFVRMFGYSREELLGKTSAELNFFNTEESRTRMRHELQTHGYLRDHPVELHLDSGETRYLSLSVELIYLDNKLHLLVINRDITEQKRIEAALRSSEERFAKAFQASPDALVLSRQQDGVILEVNHSFEQLFGYSREEALGRSPNDLNLYVDPLDRQQIQAQFKAQGMLRNQELNLRTKSGEVCTFGVSTEAILINEEACFLNILRDITEQKQAEATLRESEERFRLLADSAPVLIWLTHREGVEFVNRAYLEFVGVGEADLKGEVWASYVHPDDMEDYVSNYMEAVARRDRFEAQLRFRRADGEYRWLKSVGVPRSSPAGEFLGYIGSSFDITDIKQAEQTLTQAHQQLQAHLSNTPLGVVEWDADFRISRWAGEAENIFGWPAEAVLGKHADEFNWIYEEDKAQVLAISTALARGEKVVSRNRNYDNEGRLHYCEWYNSALIGPDGRMQSVLSLILDVTDRHLAEQDLRASEERFSKAFHASPDALVITWQEGILFEVNDSFEKILGYSREEALGKSIVGLNSYVDPAEHQQALALFKEQGFLRNYPLRLRTKAGEIRYFSLSTESIVINNELCRLNILSDITEQRRAEEALRATEERFAKAFQASPDALAISSQVSGQILEVNEGWQKLFGYSHEEAIGQTPLGLGLYAHAEDRPGVMNQLQSQGYLRNLELEVQNRWGEVRQVSLSAEPITVGEESCLITIMRDITEQKQAERDLQASEREFRAMFELAGSGKIQVDPVTSRFLRVNQKYCELTGYSREELLNDVTAAEVTHPDDRAREHEVVWPVRQGLRDHWQLEKRYLRKDGQVVWALVTGSLIRDESGRPLHTIATVQDISDRKEAEAALRQAHDELEQRVAERTAELQRSLQELNQFTYVASHDLKAPLRGVKQLASWISEDAGPLLPEASLTHLDKMHGRIQRMEKFLDDLLLYSRLERHYYQTKERVDIRALLQEIIEVLAPPATFTISLPDRLPVLMTYRMPLELTFKNLIENALKHHHRAEGRIEISARETGSFVEFSVTDDGPGIDPAFHRRIFQIFQTLHPRDERESTGAGLAIVQKAVEGQGGTITVISAPGEGATFRFTWPRKQSTGKL